MAEVEHILSKLKDENYLAHYGVLGMKWGRRRSDAELASAAKLRKQKALDKLEVRNKKAKVRLTEAEAKRKEAEVKALNREAKAQSRKEKIMKIEERRKKALADNGQTDTKYSNRAYKRMSDAELRAVVNRLNTEKQFRDLNSTKPKSISNVLNTISKTAKTAKDVYEVADALGLTKNILPDNKQDQVNKILKTLAKEKSKKK